MLKESIDQIHEKIKYDNDTGILTGKGLEELIDKTKVSQWPSGVLYIDMMGLKEINDNFGHRMGDLAIRDVSTGLKEIIRSDKGQEPLLEIERRIAEKESETIRDAIYNKITSDVGRKYDGGDEFIAILNNMEGYTGLKSATNRISDYFNQNNLPAIAIGATVHPVHQEINESIEKAEEAMYSAKKALKKRKKVFRTDNYDTGFAINYPSIGINVFLPKTEFMNKRMTMKKAR
jgi:GGDEF domain-containing protein